MTKIFGLILMLFIFASCSNESLTVTHSFNNLESSLNNQILITKLRSESITNDSTTTAIKEETSQLIDYLGTIRLGLLKLDHQDCNSITKLVEPLNASKPTDFMFEKKHAFLLKERIEDYKSYLSKQLNNEDLNDAITMLLNTYPQVPIKRKEPSFTWESYQFENLPLIQTIVNLTMIELEIRTVELFVLENISNQETTLANTPQ